MRVERDRRPRARRAVGAAHDQVGDALQAVGLHLGLGHGVGLGLQAEAAQQLGRALRVRRVVPGRGGRGHAHQLLEKAHLLVEVGVDPGVELLVVVHAVSTARS